MRKIKRHPSSESFYTSKAHASGPAASASAVTLQAELAQNSPETLRGVLARAQAGGYLFARKFSRSCDRMLAIEMARGWPAR